MDLEPQHQQDLKQWFETEKAVGLFDIKLFVSPDIDVSTSEHCEEVLKLIGAWRDGKVV